MRKSSKKRAIVLIIVGVLILVGVWIGQGIYLPYQPYSEDQIVFNVEKGQGLREISANLKKAGIIKSEILSNLFVLVRGVQGKLQAGKYVLTAAMNVPEIINKLSTGDTIKEEITIIEGWNLRDIAWYFENRGMFQAEELFEVAGFPAIDYSKIQDLPQPKDFSDEFDFLKERPNKVSLEGYLFPDTYEIIPEATVEDILRKMLQNFNEKVIPELREEIASQGKTLFEVIIMASILEKEVKIYEDRQITAGILWKRLRMGWPLQVDATLTYLIGKTSEELTKEDLRIDSLYNTYQYYGLPAGPIANPGIESIRAAIYYEESPYWFYLTTSEGEAIFSKTLEEHNIARFNYLK